jgi:hypothetical protein
MKKFYELLENEEKDSPTKEKIEFKEDTLSDIKKFTIRD